MKFKRVVSAAMALCVSVGVCGALSACSKDDGYQIAVFAYKYDDSYITTVRNALQSKFGEQEGITVTFYNGENNQQTQSTQIDTAITKGADLLIINAVDFQAAGDDLAQKCKDKGKPAIFFNREVNDSAVNKADNLCFVGTDPNAPGHMLGEMIAGLMSTDEA
ncbi:MAG: substrate-binding domain-containing protein, partial [Lachnospiraceae bacterium]